MEIVAIVVTAVVGVLGAVATIIAAYIQQGRSNLHSASVQSPTREVDLEASAVFGSAKVVRESRGAGSPRRITIKTRTAFFADLGCDPIAGEQLLFLREAVFFAP